MAASMLWSVPDLSGEYGKPPASLRFRIRRHVSIPRPFFFTSQRCSKQTTNNPIAHRGSGAVCRLPSLLLLFDVSPRDRCDPKQPRWPTALPPCCSCTSPSWLRRGVRCTTSTPSESLIFACSAAVFLSVLCVGQSGVGGVRLLFTARRAPLSGRSNINKHTQVRDVKPSG